MCPQLSLDALDHFHRMNLNAQIEQATRLSTLMQAVGFAVWQLQELETTAITFAVIRLRASRGMGEVAGRALLEKGERRTLGHVLQELRARGLIDGAVDEDLRDVLDQRNWLVHRARRETRGVLTDDSRLSDLLARLDSLADRTLALQKVLASEIDAYVLSSGVKKKTVERETEEVAKRWGLI